MRERSKFINTKIIHRNHHLNKFQELQKEIKRLELPVKSTLAEWTGQSSGYITQIFALRKSFTPDEMDAILSELGLGRSEANRLFPPYGDSIEIKEAEKLRRIKEVLFE